ncbi:putative membrane protein [Oceanisphaera litoralis]|uniref:COG4648 family protein n=1 Tax=Oceanisphaera litoralis TaxID=225144 RepID=UPI00195B4C6A|nr:hypothetical protein [Oceanisphaera litoralis]MBM7456135.1 putative membrane protein [Oceanisphaera litoralis]
MLIRTAALLLTIGYPLLVYWGLHRFDAFALLPLLLVILLLRWFSGKRGYERFVIIGSVLGVTAVVLLHGAQMGLKLYPVMVNLGLLFAFGSSLFSSQPIIERLARIREPDLPPAGVAYTRKVTQVWCVFFVLNATVSTATMLWASEEIWMLYNGLIAYIFIGLMLSLEWLIRQRVRRRR